MLIHCTASSACGPRIKMSPIWETSNTPTPVRTAKCSFIRPPLAGYSTGMSQPPKSTILAPSRRCSALSEVFLSAWLSAVEDNTFPFQKLGDGRQELFPRCKEPCRLSSAFCGGQTSRRACYPSTLRRRLRECLPHCERVQIAILFAYAQGVCLRGLRHDRKALRMRPLLLSVPKSVRRPPV